LKQNEANEAVSDTDNVTDTATDNVTVNENESESDILHTTPFSLFFKISQ